MSPKQEGSSKQPVTVLELEDLSSPIDAMLVKAQKRAVIPQKFGSDGAVTSGFGNPKAQQRL